METVFPSPYSVDHIEIYTPMAKALAYWHAHALGFSVTGQLNADKSKSGNASYVLQSNNIRLVLTAAYPTANGIGCNEVAAFINQHYCGVKRIVLNVSSVNDAFEYATANGAIPLKFPAVNEDATGEIKEAAIKLYDHSEIGFIDRCKYTGFFKPGYVPVSSIGKSTKGLLWEVDHIASEVRINEADFWSNYLANVIGTSLVQKMEKSEFNHTGMTLNINQSANKKMTFVIAEPETYSRASKVQQNIDIFGPGIHHLAFTTTDMIASIKEFTEQGVEFVSFPDSYYDLLRSNDEFKNVDIDSLQKWGILADKEGDAILFQKFIKPISDRPFFLYEIVQRVNEYRGFALKNINVLKRAEEMEIMKIKS